MQQIDTIRENDAERHRVEAVVETLATLSCEAESVAEVAHDARNMVTALALYCDLLEEPGVITPPFAHYGNELRLVAAASRRLVEKLVALDTNRTDAAFSESNDAGSKQHSFNEAGASQRNTRLAATSIAETSIAGSHQWVDRNSSMPSSDLRARSMTTGEDSQISKTTAVERAVSRTMERVAGENFPAGTRATTRSGYWDMVLAAPIQNMAQDLVANQNLLAALAGPSIAVSLRVDGGCRPVRLTGEDLTRLMVNLVKNAAEAMPAGGSIQIELSELAATGTADTLRLSIEDSGPGIAAEAHETIFCSGFTTRKKSDESEGNRPDSHRGLGLAITRSIVEAAGGRIQLSSHAPAGARFEIELPVRRAHHVGSSESRSA